ncbi:MFS transporter [Zunongwangia sp. F363]|uniref:MFS transporter n=1 Tax=Autumnicola tepida TaxID=3075595 RepID=A0ABU3CC60_9FLAO|nr:MFS transporter [Zunongwangia sp. F363]MDT0643926.1 MFS transporter [Zunongwangia sp. F363]
MSLTPTARHILPVIVFSQFCCTSLWFAGNAVMSDLLRNFNLDASALGHLTSAVQFGFILGTLIFAVFNIADRFSPSRIFFICAILGALLNLGILSSNNSISSLLLVRFLTGFSLAGIYPVGMKIAADYYQKGLGTSLGYLVGALVLGTAFPHFLKMFASAEALPWKLVIITTSSLAITGGVLMLSLVPDGPCRSPALNNNFTAIPSAFRNPGFKAAAFGYFGHMWELYAFWAFVPFILKSYSFLHPSADFDIPLLSFVIIGCGSIACVAGGYISAKKGSKITAASALFISGCCCLLSPLLISQASTTALIIFLIIWGLSVVGDSPLFSTLVAQNAPAENRGTALTIVNCIGFGISIISIQLLNFCAARISAEYLFLILAAGPAIGLLRLYRRSKV